MRKVLIKIKNFFVLLFKFTTTKPVYYCYCVCHNKYASRAWCEHCNGVNAVSEDKKKRDYAKFIARENIQEWAANRHTKK